MILEHIAKALADLNKEETISLTVQAILEGKTPQNIILQGLYSGLDVVAKRYKNKAHLYPDMYKASLIFHEALAKLRHQIVAMETKQGVRGAIGVAFGDMQDYGKNIVHMTLCANGFEVMDLGKSVPAEVFVQAAKEGVDFIGISIMTADGVMEAKKVVQELKGAGLREQVKVIVGGGGVNANNAVEIIEADAFAEDAGEAVEFLNFFFRAQKDI